MAQNLPPLGQSTYNPEGTFDLMGKIKNEIDIILDCVYNCKEISTVLTKNGMKKLYQKRTFHTE